MNKKSAPKIIIPIVVIVLGLCIYFLVAGLGSKEDEALTVSGTIEAVSSAVSPEIGGKVSQILVNEGDTVNAGDPLLRIDDTLLKGQKAVAQASLDLAQKASLTAQAAQASAQANYDLVLAAALQESAAIRSTDWQGSNPEGYSLPGGSFTPAELIAAAQTEVDQAKSDQNAAMTALEKLLVDSKNQEFIDAETKLLELKYKVQTASDVLKKANTTSNSDLKDQAQSDYDDALDELKKAQEDYDDLADSDSARDVLDARQDFVLATERLTAAETRLAFLQTGENSLKVQAAQAALAQANAAADQAAGSISQAEASLALLEAQIDKLTITAPLDGVVMSRSIELGEVIAAGTPALTIGQLDPLSITVYIAESELGSVSIGQEASLVVDSYPEESFIAEVTYISDQAEYTPRNVQTSEGRKTTVFAVRLQIANPDSRLKPGMPADVTFSK